MKCPNCNETLVMSDRNGIEIDYCPNCRGVWLDKGELDKIIERSAEYQTKPYQSDPTKYPSQTYTDHDHRYKKKRKDSFLDDLFDF